MGGASSGVGDERRGPRSGILAKEDRGSMRSCSSGDFDRAAGKEATQSRGGQGKAAMDEG